MKNTNRLYKRFQARLKEIESTIPPWRARLWERGNSVFNKRGLPTKKWERYRYTPIESRIAAVFADGWDEAPQVKRPVMNLPAMSLPGHHIVMQHGALQPPKNLPEGVSVTPFSKLEHDGKMLLAKEAPNTFHPAQEDPWEALNAALFTDGVYLAIAGGVQLTQPIFLHHYVDVDRLTMLHPRLHYHLGAQAHADIVEIAHLQGSGTALQNSVVGITLDNSATLRRYFWCANMGDDAIYLNHTKVIAGQKSHFWESCTILGEGFMRHALDVALVGEQAKTTLYGGYIGQGRGHIEHSSVVRHQVANTTSHTLYKGIVDKRSTGVFYSSEHVERAATGTETSQYHHGWALDDRAHIYARPELFINREEVACQHGATMEGMDEHKLFYLAARGIPLPLAKKMLLKAFLQGVIDPIPTAELRDYIGKKAGEALNGLD